MRKAIRDAIQAAVDKAKAICDLAIAEDRHMTDEEYQQVNDLMGTAEKGRETAEKEEALAKRMGDFAKGLGLGSPDAEANAIEVMAGGGLTKGEASEFVTVGKARRAAKTLGSRWSQSPEFDALMKSRIGGEFSKNTRVMSTPWQTKDLFTGADREESAGALLRPDYRGLLDPFYERPLTVRSLVTNGATTTDTIEYVRLVSTTNNAAVVPEATSSAAIGSGTPAVTDVEGGLKPESGFTFEKDSTTVKTIAHWIPVTKRALSDVAQIRTMIDEFLRYGLEEALEDELLSGDGTGEHFLGLANTPGIQTQAAPTGDQDVFDVLRIARRKVRIGGRVTPTAYVMNPIDWEDIELRRNENGDFYGGGPFSLTTPRVWGLPIVESEAIPPGTAWVAAWNWAVLYDRENATVQATDAHADFFVRNLVAILAEMRAAFAILRPSAFVKITL